MTPNVSFCRSVAWAAAAVSMGCSSSRSGGAVSGRADSGIQESGVADSASPDGATPDSGGPSCTPSCAGTCIAGRCFVTLTTATATGDIFGASDLVLSKATFYWAEPSAVPRGEGVSILSAPAAGGATATLASSAFLTGLAADTDHVF